VSQAFGQFEPVPYADDFCIAGVDGLVGPSSNYYVPVIPATVPDDPNVFGLQSGILGLGAVVDGVDVADMDGDGDNDFVVCSNETSTMVANVVLYTNGLNEYGQRVFTPTVVATGITGGGWCNNLRIADFNKDQLNDFVVGDNRNSVGTYVYLQGPVGTFAEASPATPADGVPLDTGWAGIGDSIYRLLSLAVGDVTGDGNADILMLASASDFYGGAQAGKIYGYAGDGAGQFDPPSLLFDLGAGSGQSATEGWYSGLAVLELNGEDGLDIVVGGFSTGNYYALTNDGAGNFSMLGSPFSVEPNDFTGVDVFDADGDGDHDLVISSLLGQTLYYVRNVIGVLDPTPQGVKVVGHSVAVGCPPLAQPEQPEPDPEYSTVGQCMSSLIQDECKGLTGLDRAQCNHKQQTYCSSLFQ